MPPKPKVIEEAEAVPKDDPKAVPKEVPKDVPKANVELPAFREEPDESNNREAPSIEDEEERAIRGPQIPDRLKEALQMEAEEGPESALEPVEPGSEPEPEPKEKRGRKVLCNHCCQIAKFEPLRQSGGQGRNPRKGRDQILQSSVAEP